MAGANLPAKKYTKTSPTVTRLSFELSGNTTQFIDIAMALSAINRKFYRQGVYYYVNSVEVYNNEAGILDLHTLGDNWVTKNSHRRGFQLFQKMNALVDGVSSVGRPKYHDFKVYMSERHLTAGSASPSLHGINAASATISPDEWAYSQFVSADDDQDGNPDPAQGNPGFADEFFVHMIGPHNGTPNNWNSVGLIKSYGESRMIPPSSSPNDLNIDITDPLMNIFDFSSEEQMNDIAQNLLEDNDRTPYNIDLYNGESGNHMQHVARIGTEQGINRIGRAAGFCAPFGLICVDPSGDGSAGSEISSSYRLILNLAVGSYHGVYAERA
jgi:hypothetical protein